MATEQVEEDGPVYTMDEALTSIGIGKFQYMIMCYADLGSISEAVETMILSFIGPALSSQWYLSPTQESLTTTVVFVGMLIGAFFWGFITDCYGRRKGLLSIAIMTAVCATLSTFSPNYSLAEIPGTLLAAIMVDKVGRKFSMALMFALSFLFLLPLLAPQLPALTTTLLFGARTFISGSFVIVNVYCREIYPTSARSTGIGVAFSVGKIGVMLSPVVAVQLVRGCNQTAAIICFEAVVVLSAVGVMLFSVETKGRELIDTHVV